MLGFRIALVVLIQSLFLIYMIYDRIQILEHGKVITLKTEPVDPRSLFRGDYVSLTYNISHLDLNQLEGDNNFEKWQHIYVAVEKRGEDWAPTGVYASWPQIIGDQVVIEGTVTDAFDHAVWADYGINSYFVPEGKGKGIEQAINIQADTTPVRVQLAVSDKGEAAIKGLILNGKMLYQETIF